MEELWTGTLAWRNGRDEMKATFGAGETEVAPGVKVNLQIVQDVRSMRLQVEVNSQQPLAITDLSVRMAQPVADDEQIFLNGYQSWTESKLFGPEDRIPPLRGPFPHLINTTGDYTFYKGSHHRGHLHAWSMTSLVRADGSTMFWMDANPESGYTLFEWDCQAGQLTMHKDVGGRSLQDGTRLLDVEIWEEPTTEMTHLPLIYQNQRPPAKAPASGWTSWYNYYTKITEEIILDNLRAYAQRDLKIDFFQIDDGWQPAVGDWTTANAKFPQGMAYLADQIHRYGYQAGLWLAPLIVEQKSTIYQQHRHWLLTHDGERLVEAGYNPGWGGLAHGTYYVLNLDMPEVQAHLHEVFDTVLNVWGYDLVKLDFLFAAAIVPAGGKSRGQRMYEACELLRHICGDKLILGCGVPLFPAKVMADYCRIGPDIGLKWELGIAEAIHLRETISTHTALHNTINRRHFSRRLFQNDPDVFILRNENNDLSPQQKQSLLLINHIFGDLLFTSDNIGGYDDATMRLYRTTFPLLPRKVVRVENAGEQYRIWFEVNARRYFAAANLSRVDEKVALPAQTMYRNGEGFIEEPKAVYLKPFETRVYLELPKNEWGVAGSDLHIFPGCEVADLLVAGDAVTVTLHAQVSVSGTLVLRVGGTGEQVDVNGHARPVRKRDALRLVILEVVDGKLV
jgi:alpha-galactosidase